MPTLTPEQLELLRAPGHRSEYFLSVLRPRVMWTMQINGSPDVGEVSLSLDGGTGVTDFAQDWLDDPTGIPGMEMWVGTSPGEKNVGVVRLRTYATADAGVTASVLVSRNNLAWGDGQYVSFIYNWPLKPMFPLILPDGTFTKEGDIEYTDQNTQLGPVVIAGTWRGAFLYTPPPFGTIIAIDMSGSYTTAPGATIVEYDAQVIGCDATCGGIFASPDPTGNLTLYDPGAYWVRFKVTDSNGNTQISYRLYFIHDPDPSSSDYPIRNFSISGMDGDWDSGGWKCRITFYDENDLPIADTAPILLWERASYGSTDESVTVLPDEYNDGQPNEYRPNTTLFAGYLRNTSINQDRSNGQGVATCEVTTLDGLMRQHYQYSISLETVPGTPDKWYEFPSYLDPGLAVYHFLKWHTRVLESADVIGLRDNTDGIAYTEMEDGNFYAMPDDYYANRSIRYHITCDKGGRLHAVPEVQLLTDTERDALDVAAAIEKIDTSGKIEIIYHPENTTAQVNLYGFAFNGTFLPDGKPDATPLCAVAPGIVPDDDGPVITQINYQTLRDQTHANQMAGRFYAHMNNEYPEVRINFGGHYLGVLDPAYAEWWTIDIAAADTVWGIEWSDRRMKLRRVSASLDSRTGIVSVSAIFEPEAIGPEGVPTNCPEVPTVDDGQIPEIPPPEQLGGAIMTGASAYYLPLLSSTWDLRTADPVSDLGADPWWRVKQGSSASGDAIVWRCGVGNIYRSDDAGLTWEDKTPATLSDCGGATIDPANVEFLRYDGSFIEQDRHVFIAVYNNAGSWLSWLVTTDDDGDTWSDVCLNGEATTPGWGTEYEIGATMFRGSIIADYVGGYPLRVVVELTSTKFFFMFRGGDGVGCVIGIKNPDNSISFGDVYYLDTTSTISSPYLGTCAALSSTLVAMVYGSVDLWAATATVTGTVITFSDQTLVGDADVDVSGAAFNTAFASPMLTQMIDDTFFLAAAVGVTLSGGMATTLGVYAKVITFDETGVSGQGSWAAGDTGVAIESVDIYKIDDDHVFAALGALRGNPLLSSSHYSRGVIIERSGLAVTFGTSGNIDAGAGNRGFPGVACDGEAVMVYSRTSLSATVVNAITADVGTLLFTVDSQTTVESDAPAQFSAFCAYRTASNTFRIAAAYSATEMRVWTMTGTTLDDTIELEATFDHGFDLSFTPLGANDFILVYGGRVRAYSFGSGGGSLVADLRAIDVRIGRETGGTVYVTCVSATENRSYLLVCDTSPAIATLYALGAAASGDLGVETFFGEEGYLAVYGRFTHDSLGNVQIIFSDDGGATFSALVDSWGSDRCGALRISSSGAIRAIRCTSSTAKMYTFSLNHSPTYRSTINFPAGVNLRALAVSVKGVAYLAANVAQGFMVSSSRAPFVSWKDITYNHQTDDPVNSVIVL